jgi:hypothetical protein
LPESMLTNVFMFKLAVSLPSSLNIL